MSFKEKVRGLAALPPVEVNGTVYAGTYFAEVVAINPELLDAEAADTPQIVAELGRLASRAWRLSQEADLAYRQWRERETYRLMSDPEAAEAASIPLRGKTPSKTAIDAYVRTLPEYADHHTAKMACEEAWQTVNSALDAARARSSVIRAMSAERQQADRPGGVYPHRTIEYTTALEDAAYPPIPPPLPPRRES